MSNTVSCQLEADVAAHEGDRRRVDLAQQRQALV